MVLYTDIFLAGKTSWAGLAAAGWLLQVGRQQRPPVGSR